MKTSNRISPKIFIKIKRMKYLHKFAIVYDNNQPIELDK